MRFGQSALRVWRERLGRDDLPVLMMAVEVAIAMQLDGRAADARRLILETRPMLEERYGDQHEVTLLCANAYGADLRARGQFSEALQLDLSLLPKFEDAFGPDHERTLNVRNNIAADYRRLGHFRDALDIDLRTFEDRLRILGDNDQRTLYSHDMVANDLRGLGRYQDSLDIARKVVGAFAAAGGRENPDWLNARTGFAAALRKAGHHWDALQESEEVVQRYRDYLGPDHTYTLRAAVNLINDRRAVAELASAEDLGRGDLGPMPGRGFSRPTLCTPPWSTSRLCCARPDVRRRRGSTTCGPGMPSSASTVTCIRSLWRRASTTPRTWPRAVIWPRLSGLARTTLANCQSTLGDDHPDTLMAAANLAIDVAASGNQATGGPAACRTRCVGTRTR